MKDLRIELTDEGGGLYLAVDPDGVWAKSTRPDNFITIDWDRQGRVIGIELLGTVAREAVSGLLRAVADYPAAEAEAIRNAFATANLSPSDVSIARD